MRGVNVTGSCQRFLSFALGFAILAALAGKARSDVLVLDVCMDTCRESDWLAIGNLRRVFAYEMGNRALIATVGNVIERLGESLPFPGIDDPSLTVEQLTRHLKDGINEWTAGDYEAAAKHLQTALTEAGLNPALVAADSTLRPLVERAYVARSVSLYRLKRTSDPKNEAKDPRVSEAKDAIADLVRMTPGPSIQDTWGTIPDKVFQLSRNDLVARGTGSLTIQVNDPAAVFYLYLAGQPHTGVFAAEVLPGVYQVFVAGPANRSRRYRVEVRPHQHTILDIDWRRDSKFEVLAPRLPQEGEEARRPRIGFTFSSYAERRLETEFAGRIAAQVPGSLVVVVGKIKWQGKDAMIGAMYAPEQPPARMGVVLGNDLQAARDLASFLMTDRPAPNVIRLAAPPWEGLPPAQVGGGVSASTKWIVIGGGAVAIAGGAGLYAIGRLQGWHTAPPYGVGLGVSGALAVGIGLWLGSGSRGGPVVSASASSAMITWAGNF